MPVCEQNKRAVPVAVPTKAAGGGDESTSFAVRYSRVRRSRFRSRRAISRRRELLPAGQPQCVNDPADRLNAVCCAALVKPMRRNSASLQSQRCELETRLSRRFTCGASTEPLGFGVVNALKCDSVHGLDAGRPTALVRMKQP